jgi:hypothetical protein
MKKKCASSWFFLTTYSMKHGSENVKFIKKKVKCNTGRPHICDVSYPWFTAAWKKIWKIKGINGS